MKNFTKLVFAAAGFAAFAASFVVAQQAPRLSFEVASIKPNNSNNNQVMIGAQAGLFNANGVATKMLIRQAYRVQDFQIIGGPAWLNSDRYDIQAKTPEGPIKPNDIESMLQSLLEERFQLKIHREMRDLPVYELVTAKDGPKLQQAKDADGKPILALPTPGSGPRGGPGALPPPGPPAPGAPVPPGLMRMGRGEIAAGAASMTQLIMMLSQQLGRPVVDKTGLTGLYDLKLQWTPEVGQGFGGPFGGAPAGPAAGGPGPSGAPPVDGSGPSIFTALQEQLGLRLESTRSPVEVIVIDSVEKPTAN